MKTSTQCILILAVLLTIGCRSGWVSMDYDRDVDFEKYDSFYWLPIEENGEILKNAMIEKRFKRAIIGELENRGYKLNEHAPSFFVAYHIHADDRDEVVDHYYYHDPYIRGRGLFFSGGLSFRSERYRSGYQDATLTLDILDAERRELIWRGWALTTVTGPSISEAKINKAIRRILEKFPPIRDSRDVSK